MKFYYVALTINPEQPVKTVGGKRLAYYLKRYQAEKECDSLNIQWANIYKGKNKAREIYKVYCVESEPKEIE